MSFRFFVGVCLLACAGILFALSNSGRLEKPEPIPNVQTIPEIRRIGVSKETKNKLRAFYLAFADVVEHDAGHKIKTWKEFRTLNVNAGKACFGDELRTGDYARLGETIDLAIQALRKNENIDTKQLSERLREIAWSIGG